MHMYGCELWNVTDSDVDKFYVSWRKVRRRIWKLPSAAHNRIIHNIASNIHIILEKRRIKCIHSALNGNEMCEQILCVKLRCKKSSFAENFVIGLPMSHISWAK